MADIDSVDILSQCIDKNEGYQDIIDKPSPF